jgi:2-aminoadipate transaminase
VGVISFARGAPAPECLPVEELAECAQAALARDGVAALSYGPAGGYGPLREWLGARHGAEPGRVLLVNGGLQGFSFLARHLLRDGGRVLVEGPTYDRPLRILAELGAEVVPLPMDGEGLEPDALERVLEAGPPPAFLYTIPTFQNPSGRTLGESRRRALVELARARELLVVEDDPYGLVRFDGEALPTVHALAGGEGVVYASSFSKTVAPGLRVGYLVLPAELVQAVEDEALANTIAPVLPAQAIVWEFVRRGSFEPNLVRVRGLLRRRRDAMLVALERAFPDGVVAWSRPEGGYFLWLELPVGVDAGELLVRAGEAGVTFVPGSDFFPGGRGGGSAARLAYSYATPAEIGEGIALLAELLPARITG